MTPRTMIFLGALLGWTGWGGQVRTAGPRVYRRYYDPAYAKKKVCRQMANHSRRINRLRAQGRM